MQLNDIAESHPHSQGLSCRDNGRIEARRGTHRARPPSAAAGRPKTLIDYVRNLRMFH